MVNPAKNTICLWYDGDAEDAARFYATTFPDSSVGAVHPSYCQMLCMPGLRGVLFHLETILEGHALYDLRQVMRGP